MPALCLFANRGNLHKFNFARRSIENAGYNPAFLYMVHRYNFHIKDPSVFRNRFDGSNLSDLVVSNDIEHKL